MIILGPPLESCEPTPPFCNVEEFTRICLPMCSLCPFRAEERNLTLPCSQFLHLFSSLLSCIYILYVCYTAPASFCFPRSLADESLTARQCDFLYGSSSSCFPVDILSQSAFCRLLGLPDTLPFYMPLMSILRLAVFLSL